jgi:hypothetical protein
VKLRILTVFAIMLLFPVGAYSDTTANFTLPSGVAVQIVEAPFQRSKFKVTGCTGIDFTCLINGRVPMGVDGREPKTYVKSIAVTFDGQSYELDASDMYDAWGSRPLEFPGVIRYFGGKCFDPKPRSCQFRGLFSDGAGSFVAEWFVVNGRPFRTILTGSDDVVNLFMKHIDPPEFD